MRGTLLFDHEQLPGCCLFPISSLQFEALQVRAEDSVAQNIRQLLVYCAGMFRKTVLAGGIEHDTVQKLC